jgi:hypothetical protein
LRPAQYRPIHSWSAVPYRGQARERFGRRKSAVGDLVGVSARRMGHAPHGEARMSTPVMREMGKLETPHRADSMQVRVLLTGP